MDGFSTQHQVMEKNRDRLHFFEIPIVAIVAGARSRLDAQRDDGIG